MIVSDRRSEDSFRMTMIGPQKSGENMKKRTITAGGRAEKRTKKDKGPNHPPQGIPINLISRESIEALGSEERVDFVLGEVKEGKVLILEMGLSAMEEADLIKQTMMEIDHETFIGIEIQSCSATFPQEREGTWLERLLNRRKPPRMAVIGPASLIRTIHKDGNVIQTMLVTREHVIDEMGGDLGSLQGVEEGFSHGAEEEEGMYEDHHGGGFITVGPEIKGAKIAEGGE